MMPDQQTVRVLYKKLLGLYPRGFREQLGESMEQTFADRCSERQQAHAGMFSFVLWMFVETAVGIIHEHFLSIKGTNPMKNLLTSLRLPAIISFLIVLPLMLLDFLFVIVKRLDTFSLRNALDFAVLFGFLWIGLAAIILILMPLVRHTPVRNSVMAHPAFAQAGAPKNILTNPTSAAIVGVLLALPFVTILSLLLLGIEPHFGPLEPLLNNPDPDQPDLGSLVVLGAFLLSVLACIIVRAPIVRTMRAGGGRFAHPVNLLLAVVILFFMTMLVGGIIVDQYPCWIGVPNCD
jgi:hypothetical protein